MNKTSIQWTHRPGTIGMTWNPDPKGGDPTEWPEHLRVREFPRQKVEAVSI